MSAFPEKPVVRGLCDELMGQLGFLHTLVLLSLECAHHYDNTHYDNTHYDKECTNQ